AWSSFATLLRRQYGYFNRPGVDGEAILAAFADRAKQARSDRAFIDILRLIAHDFADPHLIVGPPDPGDWAIVPTASDLFAVRDGAAFRITDVRADGAAGMAGIRPGATVLSIDGAPPEEVIAGIMGRPFAALTPEQADFGLLVALAGRRDRPRTLLLADRNGRRSVTLAPTAVQAKRVAAGPLLETERRGDLGIIRIDNSLGNQELIPRFSAALASLADTHALLIDLRNTPSGGNTSVARGIMGHFVDTDRPYQMHVVPFEARVLGPSRKFVEYVAPFGARYAGKVFVSGGHWTGSMGEGMMIGFDAIGAETVGTDLGHLLGATEDDTVTGTAATVALGTEQLFTVTGLPREAFRPHLYLPAAERDGPVDPVLRAIEHRRDQSAGTADR
ncbi:MAG: hypothetical protein INR65_12610, partial [Gluconacetobacter diazotrophicus]|nr:hypothetical protein [Gluconacetobacter diazotrophicus]